MAPACPHPMVTGPAILGSFDVYINGKPALRQDDIGIHAACCALNMWTATKGAPHVNINGKPAHRLNDAQQHCGGVGKLVMASADVIIGDGGGGGGGGSAGGGSGSAGVSANRKGVGGGEGATGSVSGSAAAPPGPAAGPASPAAASSADAPTPISPDQIEVEVVGVNGAARPNVPFSLKLPDGAEKDGDTGRDGVIRFSGLTQSGSCQLTFPTVKDDPEHTSAAGGRIAFFGKPVTVVIGKHSTVELPPRVARAVLTGLYYDTDKSFLLEQAMAGMRGLVDFYRTHPNFQVLFSGHTDTVGSAGYNLLLSIERALTMEAYLKDDVGAWVKRFTTAQTAGQLWGTVEIQHMLSALPEDAAHFYTQKPVSGKSDAATRQAVKDFQAWSNEARGTQLRTDGTVDADTRKETITAYLALDGTSLPKGTVTDHHGCGFFHLKVPTGPDVDEQQNRRTEVFFFEKEIKPKPRPCKSPGCTEYPQWHAAVQEEIDLDLPAGDGRTEITLQIVDEIGLPIKKHGFKLERDDGQTFALETDDDGKLNVHLKTGEGFVLTIDDAQEAAPGDSTKSASGQHFAAGQGGPK